MEAQKVDMFITMNRDKMPEESFLTIREKLLQCDDNQWVQLSTIQFKDPTTALIISLLGGCLGIDRFYIGDTGLGIGKLLVFIFLGWWLFIPLLWPLIDLFLIMKATRKNNFNKIRGILII